MEIKSWILRLCALSILCAIAQSLLPFPKGKTAVGMLCGVLLLYATVTPLSGQNLGDLLESVRSFDAVSQSEAFEERSDSAVLLASEQGFAAAFGDRMKTAGIAFEKVRVACEMQSETVVPVSIRLRGSFDASQRRSIEEIRTELDMETAQIVYEAEDAYEN